MKLKFKILFKPIFMESVVVWCGRNCFWPLQIRGGVEMNNSITQLYMPLNNPIAHGIGPIPENHITQKLRRGNILIAAREEAARNPVVECPGESKGFSECSEDYKRKTEATVILSQTVIDWLIHLKDKDCVLQATELKAIIYKENKILFFPELGQGTHTWVLLKQGFIKRVEAQYCESQEAQSSRTGVYVTQTTS